MYVVIPSNINIDGITHCMWLVELPTSEDIRDYNFPSNKKTKVTKRMVKAANGLIDSMMIHEMKPDPDTFQVGNQTGFQCEHTFNPSLHTLHRVYLDR